jgi:toxin FitB
VTRYLIDTNIISAGAPTRHPKQPDVLRWMDLHSSDLFLSVISVAEIVDRIAKAKREGTRRKAADLSLWLQAVLHLYGERVLTFDVPTAEVAGGLSDLARGRGHAPGLADVVIAATAKRHDLVVLSRNQRHFGPMDVPVIDPFEQLPSTT